MGQITIGPKLLFERISKPIETFVSDSADVVNNECLLLKNKIVELEFQLQNKEKEIIEVIKEVPVEVKIIEERIIEKPITIIEEKIVEIVKEIPIEVKVVEEKIIEKEIEVIKEIEKVLHIIPKWALGVMAFETALIFFLLVIKHI